MTNNRLEPEIARENEESMRELVAVLRGLPECEREKFLYMAQGAALVTPRQDAG